jgi:hypothetical protein
MTVYVRRSPVRPYLTKFVPRGMRRSSMDLRYPIGKYKPCEALPPRPA